MKFLSDVELFFLACLPHGSKASHSTSNEANCERRRRYSLGQLQATRKGAEMVAGWGSALWWRMEKEGEKDTFGKCFNILDLWIHFPNFIYKCSCWLESVFGWLVIFDEPNGWKFEKLIYEKYIKTNIPLVNITRAILL